MSLELIIVCDCMFPSTLFSLAVREEGEEGGSLPKVASTSTFVHSENKFVSNNKPEAALLISRPAAGWREIGKDEEFPIISYFWHSH